MATDVTHSRVSSENEAVDIPTGERTVKDIDMSPSKHNPTGVNITPLMFHDILQQSQEVLMRPMLLMAVGLPNSGKSRAIRQLLKPDSRYNYRQQEFLDYNMISIVSKQKKINEETTIENSQHFHDFGFLAGLKSLHNKLDSFTEDGPQSALDDDDTHHRHRMGLIDTWEKLKECSIPDESRLFQSKELGEGPALVKIWDVDFDSFSLQFLRCFSGHFYNSYTWLFTDIKRDLDKLYVPPFKEDTQLMARRSRIQYLLNPSKLSSKLNGTRHNVCTIFATTLKKSRKYESELEVHNLQEECQIAASQIGSPDLISKKVISLSFDKTVDKILLDQLHQIATFKPPQGIPLSHLFLRGSLELESSVFMRREELKRKARLCGIDDDESFDEFCKSFTSFGSIINVGLVSTSDIIIVKPDEFLKTLNEAFNFEKIEDYQVAHDGILTSDVALSLFGKEYQLFLEVLEAVGLATQVAGSQCQPAQNRMCYYIPSVRLHGEEINFNPNRIQLVTSMRYPSISLIVALTKHLLQAIPSSQLVLTMNRNKTRIKSPESEIEIVFHGEVIEFAVSQKSFITEIVEVCKKLPHELKNRYGEAKFYFAVLCEKDDNYIGINFYRKRHILPIDGEFDCDKCTFTEDMKIWSSTIKEASIDEKFKLNGKLMRDDITRLSAEISTYERVYVLAFIKALGQDRQLPDDQSKWENVLMAAINEWMLEPHKESTKKKMAVILNEELHMKFQYSHSEKKLKFKQLAKQLDIQTLSIEQKDSLTQYYQKLQKEQKLEMESKDHQILQFTQNMKDIIQLLNNSQKHPIVFEYEAEGKELTIIDQLKKAIQEREKEVQKLVEKEARVSAHSAELQKLVDEKDSHIECLQQELAELKKQVNEKEGHIIVESFQQTGSSNEDPLFDSERAKGIFREHYGEMTKLMAVPNNITTITPQLFAKKLISPECLQRVNDESNRTDQRRANDLMTALQKTINDQPHMMKVLIDVMNEIEEFQPLAKKLSDKLFKM